MKNAALIEVKANDGVSLAVSAVGNGETIVFLLDGDRVCARIQVKVTNGIMAATHGELLR